MHHIQKIPLDSRPSCIWMYHNFYLHTKIIPTSKNSLKKIKDVTIRMMSTYSWYQKLKKPSWSPPSSVFGPVWTVLYIIIAISFISVFYNIATGYLTLAIGIPFALNLIFNFSFTPIQFGLKNNYLASLDILLVLGTLIWALFVIYPYISWVTLINIPYLLWVLFATTLQITITYLNK